jgi:hypothetical protein
MGGVTIAVHSIKIGSGGTSVHFSAVDDGGPLPQDEYILYIGSSDVLSSHIITFVSATNSLATFKIVSTK